MISGGHDNFPIIKEDYPQPTVSYNTAAKGNIVHLPSNITRSKRNYASLEKLALALRHVSRRLRRYFKAHPIKVITDQPIEQILSKAEASGKLAKYSIKLGAYNIAYKPHSEVKGQVLADFVNEVPVGSNALVPKSTLYTVNQQTDHKEEWVLYTDRGSSIKGSGAGLILISPTKTEYTYALRLNFTSTNNQAEYEALLACLRIEKKMNVQSLSVNVDSKLVAS
ncbi:reverse transcriptase domain-containing protein [Tanacetum coccineum]